MTSQAVESALNLPDHFHDLKTTLQAKFELLKKAASKNVQNIPRISSVTTAIYLSTFWLYQQAIYQAGTT